ncbi:MAG: DUF1232 domain-containing protein [Gemmatimonadaceae bacterium]|jgi:uncharacterized membrane protein YkvA (DUF1232 family)|nr:DUF1232 domain-containing protein [Gemmatimonadaceae bacterium]
MAPRSAPRTAARDLDELDEFEGDDALAPLAAEVATPAPRTGQKRTVIGAIKQLPAYLKLLGKLVLDRRVSKLDKGLVIAAIVYIVSPLDFIPDLIPFLGEVDDLFLLLIALQRLIGNAGRRVLLDHWTGDPRELDDPNLLRVLSAAAFFLPGPLRRRLMRLGR